MNRIVLILFAFWCQYLLAVPAYPVRKTLKTQSGETKTVVLRGDEYISYYADEAGVFYKLLPSGVLQKYSEAEKSELIDYSEAQRSIATDRRVAKRATRDGVTGHNTGLVILAEFADVQFTVGTHEIFEDFFNMPNYSEYGMTGSVHDYFYDQSYQQFDLNFDIVGPVQLPKERAFYGEHVGKVNDINARQFAVDAIMAAASEVDFSKYDWNQDGIVDQVFIIFAGHNEAEGGPAESIWPHEWSISNYGLNYNGVYFNTYGCTSELKGASGSNLCGVGTACHEFSHCLGLLDTYDTSTNGNFGMGDWDIMSSGNYIDKSRSPMAYTAIERWMCGWLDPVELNTEYSVTDMKALEDEPEAYILYNDGNSNEFYLLENRQLPKWGSALGAHGLMVMHVDFDEHAWAYNKVNTATGHQRMTFIPADGVMSHDSYGGDPFPGTTNAQKLTDTTSPAATVYNRNVGNTYLMGKPIQHIVESPDGLISFDAMQGGVLPPDDLAADILPSGAFALSWQEIPEAPHYELHILEVPEMKANPYESYLLEEEFEVSCYAAEVDTLNDVSAELDTYTQSQGWSGENLYMGPEGLQLGTITKPGSLRTPTIKAPFHGLTTALLSVSAVGEDSVNVSVDLYFEDIYLGSFSLAVLSGETNFLTVPECYSNMAFEIVPDKPAIVGYFSLHSGEYGMEDFINYDPLGTHAYAGDVSSRSIIVDENSYLFEDVKKGYSYQCSVRASFDDDSHYGMWSSVIEVNPESEITGIDAVKEASLDEDAWYDLQGRRVNTANRRGFFFNRQGKYFVK